MIVPANRLILLTALTTMPLALLSIAIPSFGLPAAVASVLFLSIAVFDAAFSKKRTPGFSLEFPETVYLTRSNEGKIEFLLKRTDNSLKRLRLGLEFPHHMKVDKEDIQINLSHDAKEFFFHWNCVAHERGTHTFNQCYAEVPSSLGLWHIRSTLPAAFEARVYPNLMGERKNIAALFLNRSNLGIHAQRQVGQGREFEKLREYIPGDSYDQIHWKGTAKRGHPVSKIFRTERTQEVYVIVDASRLSTRMCYEGEKSTSPGKAKKQEADSMLEHFIKSALIMGSVTQRQGDLFGLITFSDKVHGFMRAKNGSGHYTACRDLLCCLREQSVNPDFNELSTFIGLRLRRRALLIFLTSLDDPVLAENFEQNLGLLCRKHLVLVNMLRPDGIHPMFSNNRADSMDDLYSSLGGHMFWHNIMEMKRNLRSKGVRFSLLDKERMSTDMVHQYMSIKQRQLL
ncbi:MAG: DUF58 domain-containing protein [Deltaproteobacteria bacterium]|nr:DUF58 domain-containing protein [Deltaproteobacteria bacterium]